MQHRHSSTLELRHVRACLAAATMLEPFTSALLFWPLDAQRFIVTLYAADDITEAAEQMRRAREHHHKKE
jgi:hypothetical protein